jgi:dephospho-CoA kinase
MVGLTGGIGCGKSTVGALLAERGAEIIDVDVLSRELQLPGQPFFEQIVARWGPGVLDESGQLDRAALGQIVFRDRAQLAELTNMAAPITEVELVRRALVHRGTAAVVVVEAAMFGHHQYGMEGLIVVDTPPELALARLVEQRGMNEDDARNRIASQVPRERRLADADLVIDNHDGPAALRAQIDRAWSWIHELPDATPRVQR